MTALEQFNALNGTKAYRKDLENILQKAKDENNASLVYRISKTLNAFPDVNRFEIEIISYPEAPQGLSGAQHSGNYKEALDDCGRLRKGWKFVKGNVVKIEAKPKKEAQPKKEKAPQKETKKDKKYKFVVITDDRPNRVIAVFSYTNPNIKDLRESFWKNGEGKYYETTEEGLRNYTFGMGVYPFEEAKKHIEEKYTEGKDFIYFIIEKDGGRDEAISLVEKPKKETDKTAIDEIKKIVQERLKNQGKPRLYEVLHLESAKGIFIFSWSDLGNIDGTKKKENALAKGLYQYTFPKFKNTQEKIEFSNQVWYDLLINKSLTLKRKIEEPTLNIINYYLGKNTIEDIERASKKTTEETKPKKGKTPKKETGPVKAKGEKASNFSLLQEPTKVLLKFSKDTNKEYYKKYTDEKGFVGVDFLKDNLKDLKKQAIIDEPQGFINTEDFEKSHKTSKIKGIDSLKTIVSKDKLYPYLECVFIEPDTYVATDALKIVVLNRPKNDGLKTGAFYDPNFKCEKLGGCSKEEFYKDLQRGFPNYKGVLFPKPKYFTEWIPLEPLIKHLKTGLEVLTKISGLKRVFTIAIKSNIEEKRFDIKNLLDALLVLESNEAKKIRIEAIDEFGNNRIQIKADNNNLAVIMPLNTGNKYSDVISPLKIAPIQLEFVLNETEEKAPAKETEPVKSKEKKDKKTTEEIKKEDDLELTVEGRNVLVNRAMYYTRIRKKGRSYDEMYKNAKDLGEKHIDLILNLSYLNPKGILISDFIYKEEERKDILKMVNWTGEARRLYPDIDDKFEEFFWKLRLQDFYKKETKEFFFKGIEDWHTKRTKIATFLKSILDKYKIVLDYHSFYRFLIGINNNLYKNNYKELPDRDFYNFFFYLTDKLKKEFINDLKKHFVNTIEVKKIKAFGLKNEEYLYKGELHQKGIEILRVVFKELEEAKGLSGVDYSQALFDDIGLNAPRHKGILKEALTEKGKLKKGWYFQDYGIIDPKGKYHPLEREFAYEYKIASDELSSRAFEQNEKRKQKGFQENVQIENNLKEFFKSLSQKNRKYFKSYKAVEIFYWAFGFEEKPTKFFTIEETNPYNEIQLKVFDKYFSNKNELFTRLENYETLRRYNLTNLGLNIITQIASFLNKEGKKVRGNVKKINEKYGLSMPFYVQEQEKKEIQPSSNSISNKIKAFQERNFEIFNIENPDLSTFLGEIERKNIGSNVITLTGGAGSGKTRFAFQFMNALAQNYKVGHASLEEHPESKLYFDKVTQYLDSQAQNNISVLENETLDGLENLINENEVIVIDSFAKLREMDSKFLVDKDLRKKYNGKLFLVIFQQTSDGKMRGGSTSEFDGDIILFTKTFDDPKENFVYPSKNRYNALPLSELKYSVFYQQLLHDEEQEQPVTDLIFDVV